MKKNCVVWMFVLYLSIGIHWQNPMEFLSPAMTLAADEMIGTEQQCQENLLSEEFLDMPDSLLGKPLFVGTDMKAPEVKNGVFSLPFGTDRKSDRFYIDEYVKLDLSGSPIFYLVLTFDKPEVVQAPTLYFHSGKGWYSMTGTSVRKLDGRTARFEYNILRAHKEGEPGGVDQADLIRISYWRSKDIDFKFEVKGFYHGRPAKVGILQTETQGEPELFSGIMAKQLHRAGISNVKIMQDRLTAKLLEQYEAMIIPVGGGLTGKTVDLLCDYLDKGGYLLVFYCDEPRLMKKMGFTNGHYIRCSSETVELSKIIFTPEFANRYAPYMPKEMEQASFNFINTQPLAKVEDSFLKETKNAPKIAGWWYDKKGKKTKYPAVLASGRGIYFSHVLLYDDPRNKENFLLALLNRFDLNGRRVLFCQKWRELLDVGHVPSANLIEYYQQQGKIIFDYLKTKGWSARDIVQVFYSLDPEKNSSQTDSANIIRFASLLDAFSQTHSDLIKKYLKSVKSVKTETRFMWEHSGTGPYPGDWDRTMKELAQNGVNGVISNMAWGGEVYYNSDLLPRSSKVEKYGDQIAQFAAAGKKYGIETHVWKVNFNCNYSPQAFKEQMEKENRLQLNDQGKRVNDYWLCPSHPKNQDLEVAVMLEIAQKYEIDGIHFDYIRYPDHQYCFCNGCRDRFAQHYFEKTGKKLPIDPQKANAKSDKGRPAWVNLVLTDPQINPEFVQWRCDQITNIVRRTREAVDQMNRKVMISAAVFSGYPGTIESVGQDWGEWCKRGYLDFVFPMDYTSMPLAFSNMVDQQLATAQKYCPVYPGIGVSYPVQLTPDKVVEQIEITRQKKTGGYCLFDLSQNTIKNLVPEFGGTPLGEKAIPFHRTVKK